MGAYWENKEFSYFSHTKCEYFPCHKGASVENFNCLFCYCPLYALGKDCGGNFRMTEKGIKDCSNCLVPHKRENYGYITERYQEVVKRMKELEESSKY
jgi:Zn-finger protein